MFKLTCFNVHKTRQNTAYTVPGFAAIPCPVDGLAKFLRVDGRKEERTVRKHVSHLGYGIHWIIVMIQPLNVGRRIADGRTVRPTAATVYKFDFIGWLNHKSGTLRVQ